MEIERLTAENIMEIAPLFDAYRGFYAQESNVHAAANFLNQRLMNNESIVFAARIGDDYVGFTQLYPTFSSVAMKNAYILNDLYVDERLRKQGVAKALMDKAFQFATTNDARFIALETEANNTTAQALYEKMGMETEKDVKHYIHYW